MDNTIETHEATGQILNVLSIDFDIIMYPCIRLYNEHINGSDTAKQIWDFLDHEYEMDKYVSYDAKTLLLLGFLLRTARSNKTRIVPLEEHQQIVDDLKKDVNYDTNLYNLTNVDFHHDIFYRKEDISVTKYFDKYNCSNWVGYLYKNNKLASYTWYKAPNSQGYDPNIIEENDRYKFDIKSVTTDEDKIDLLKMIFNTVYIVKSPQWIPYKYIHLYNLICAMAKDV